MEASVNPEDHYETIRFEGLGLRHLVREGLVKVVGAADAEVDHVHLGGDGVVEGVQEPGGVRHLRGQVMGSGRPS